ncbi:zinc finger FYVE domain-containing protein 26-like isoform X1 [Acipenser ruthenus]|uniref:zinc finger FYVE domain-containing protein 26-like isoform X1 n=1 Tax=Acipenser ruthenus TaxID=7906 RepID=UPI002740C05C|nr:zinc finger FYVE domain-containing protein 26-like isoform X1 [Acipenser ruthenus]
MHPFGREEASSLEKLFVFFTQCLQRGEWALAQACVPQLREWQAGGVGRVQEILQAIVACPYQLRWDTVGSPHRLAWLWLQVLEKWFQEQIPVFVKSELEFMLLLEELQTEASENVLKELYQAFLHSHSPNITKEKKREPRSAQLSAEAVSCLWDVLSEKPGLAQALMGYLLAHDCDSDSLHKLFIDFLQEAVCGLRSGAGGRAVEQVYSGLSVLHCNPEQPAGELRQLCEALFESSWGEAAPLREERVLSCLLRPHDHALVSLYSSVATERTKEKLLEHKPHEQVSAELSEAEKVILALFSHCDRTSAWKTIYFDCLSSGKHFLEQVLVTALSLMKREDVSSLHSLLNQEFRPLSRLLLLLGWTHCQSLESAKTFLHTLHENRELHCDFVLKEFGDGLSTQVKILEWCSENNRNSIPSTDLLRHLHSVDCHSALYILHSLTTLPALDEERVIQLLQGLPATHSNGPAGLAEASTLVRRRNVVLFQGFCAMKYAVYALCVNAHKHSACKDCLGSLAEEQPESREEPGKEQCSSPGYPELFKKYMDKCHQHLQALPVAFRLELLENIYSLLFTSHSDFSSEKAEESALEEDDEGVEEGEVGRNSEVRSLNSSLEHSDYPETGQQGKGESSQPQRITHLKDAASQTFSHLHLKHFANGASGFMADEVTLEAFLKLLKEHLDGIDRDVLREGERAPDTEKELAECLNCSISADAFNTRLQRLSKYISETQWRFQVVTSNKTAEGQISATKKLHPVTLRRSSFKRRRRAARSRADGALQLSMDSLNADLSASTSDGSASAFPGQCDPELRPLSVERNLLIPMMLSPPESLLISCILRGNFMEARQVVLMFNLESSPCYGELVFMERYQQVVEELARVEQKIENQSADSSGRKGSSSRSTLQAIGSAAAAGMVFYSISDVADKLLSCPGRPVPSLQEEFWVSSVQRELPGALEGVLEDLSPAGMAAFDLACTQCQLWKTCKQLLETAERRLHSTLEAKGQKVDSAVQPPEGIRGFPAVLQQISKILNHTPGGRGGARPEVNEEKLQSHFSCSVLEVLLTCYPALTEESMATQLSISHRLEHTLHTLSTAIDCTELRGGSLFASLVEQASLKPQEREVHPVRSQMKALLRTMDQHIQTQGSSGRARPDYIRSGFDYINTLAAVLVRSLSPELDPVSEVKLGNPLLVLQQTPAQLLSHLLFERQVSPDRISSLLHKEELNLSIQQVIVSCSCESLPLWDTRKQGQNPSLLDSVGGFVQQYAEQYLPNLETAFPTSTEGREDVTAAVSPPVSPGGSTQFILTPSALSFLKSHSSLLATLACLTASKGVKTAKTGLSSWRDFRGKRETPLDLEQITKECDHLLQEFPVLERFLRAMSEPLEGSPEEPAGLVGALCGQPCSGLVLSGVHCSSTLGIAAGAFQEALVTGALSRALSILQQYGQEGQGLSHMQDVLLSCAAVEEVDGMKHLFLVKDADLRARLVLHCLEKWPLGACLEILMYCVSDSETAEELKENLLLKKQELQIYQQVLDLSSPSSWSDWQEVRRDSREDPESVLDVILRAKGFGLCERWVELHPVSPECRMRLQREHLLHLLETGDSEDAFQLLQSLSDPELCLLISEQALDQRPGLTACHFLANYLTSHFHKSVAPTRQHEIQAMRIGSELLLTLPEPARQDYFQLSSSPLLMLEQLLMNMKVDWAAVAVLSLQQLLLGQEAGFTAEDINELLSRYARKALDFPYAPRERTRADSVISLQDLLIQTPGQETFSPSLSTETTPSSTAGSSPLHTPKAPPERAPCRQKLEFTPPERPPEKKNWIPDQQQDVCMVCRKERFTMFNRRHHCRRCGRLVCNTCSTRKMVVQGCREDPVRVCDQCYSFYNQDTQEEHEQADVAGSPGSGCLDFSVILQLPEVPERLRKLSLNEAENEIERSEFYYEQAPSASLCIAILNLHSNSIVCGQQLIEHCRQLSRGLTNPEVDPRLLTDIMKQLLFSAKLMFVKAGRSQDLALCDSYISKVDVLKILVSANYKYVPSLDQILQPAAVSRLRNQLLEAEYYQLAVEVSTKSGLDPGGVWHAWGMACLKAGNLTAAREKFSRCLKAPFDPNQQNHGPQLLQDIIQHLESTVKPSFSLHNDDILASLKQLEDALMEATLPDRPEGKIQQNSCYQECLYYLHTYGTNLAIISFYMRHDCVRDALIHLLNKESPEDVFLDGIFVPSYESGKLHVLENLMETIDSGLESWSRYLIASCKHLQKRGFFNILYDLQQFMKDHVRAAMTCIRFFTHKAESYVDLGGKQKWLIKAKDHLKTYLQEQSSRSSGRRKSASSFRKKMSSSDVSRHINTIELQIEVTRFLHRCESSGTSRSTASPPANLFGNNSMKMDVACKVMLGGKNIEEGFGIAFRIIQPLFLQSSPSVCCSQDFLLDAAAVYSRAVKRLVKHRQYREIRQLLKCVSESGAATKNDCDNIILSCIEAADKVPSEAKELDSLILEMKSTDNKIKAYLLCSKLRSAYLIAVKLELPRASQLVQEVLGAAEQAGDLIMQDICTQWLSEHQGRSSTAPRQGAATRR